MVIAPTISAITALGGMPSVSSGMNEVCAAALLALSGAATPSIAPRPNRCGSAGALFSECVGGKRGDDGTAAGQDAEDRSEHGAAKDRRQRGPHVLFGRHQPGDLL